MPIHRRGNINGKKAVHTEHAQNNAHFDGPTTIRLGSPSALTCSEHTPLLDAHSQFDAMRCGPEHAQVCSQVYI